MNRPLRFYAFIATAAVLVGVLENTFFGADHGEPKHSISVVFFFLAVAGILSLIVIGIVALIRKLRGADATS